MTSTLYKQIQLVTPDNGTSKPLDLWIEDGIIKAIEPNITPNSPHTVIVSLPNTYISIGWIDMGVYACDPGYEHREDLASMALAAQTGGFTGIVTMPNTHPAIHSKSEIAYIKSKAALLNVDVYPLGAISNDCTGKDIAELYDMHHAGAVAFTDGEKPVQDAGLLLRAMQYATAFNGLIINRPYHKSVAAGGQMHEGIVSTSLGLKGIPALSEHLMVQRDLSLLEYAGTKARLHIHLVSTALGVDMIRSAKARGQQVTASVALANLCLTDEALAMQEGSSPFDSNLKLMPPLRAQSDIDALITGLLDGTIDFICTNHTPWDVESKNLEFPYAEFGMTGLETAYPMYNKYLSNKIPLDKWVDLIAFKPRQVLGIPIPKMEVGQAANLTVFSSDEVWTLTPSAVKSKSLNTPFLGKALKGKAVGIMFK